MHYKSDRETGMNVADSIVGLSLDVVCVIKALRLFVEKGEKLMHIIKQPPTYRVRDIFFAWHEINYWRRGGRPIEERKILSL